MPSRAVAVSSATHKQQQQHQQQHFEVGDNGLQNLFPDGNSANGKITGAITVGGATTSDHDKNTSMFLLFPEEKQQHSFQPHEQESQNADFGGTTTATTQPQSPMFVPSSPEQQLPQTTASSTTRATATMQNATTDFVVGGLYEGDNCLVEKEQEGEDDEKGGEDDEDDNDDVCRPFSADERVQVADLRRVLPELLDDRVDDAYILRWLRSKDGRFDETAEGLKKNIVFRRAWALDQIGKWEAPEILEKYCGYGFLSDRDGNPILMSLLGNMDVEGMLRSVQSKDYIIFSLAAIEKGMELCRECAQRVGRPFEQMMLVFDLDHISSAHYSSKQFTSSFTTLVLLFQEHYPLVLRKILIIRAPEMARIAFNSMTSFLSPALQKLIEMPSEEAWSLVLADYVDLDAWPVHWGGRMLDWNGDPKCPSKIRYGLGPVPDSYYLDPDSAMNDYDQLTTVYAGDKHLIELKAKKANTRISWQYMTTEDDIGFAIYYDKTGVANSLTEMESMFPHIRLECSQVPVSGSLVCDQPGRYIIEFDNYYSWFSAKQLKYNIEIDE